MTAVRVIAMALRLLALWMVLFAFQSVGIMIFMTQRTVESARWWVILPGLGILLAAVALWKFAPYFAVKLYPGEPSHEKVEIDGETLLRVGCSLLGLWLLTTALPGMARFMGLVVQSARFNYSGSPDVIQSQALFVGVQLVMIVVLLTRNRSLARLILR